jgi:hypothetical protein
VRREFRLPESDEAYLDGLGIPWETVRDGGSRWLLLHNFPVCAGYTAERATVAIRIDGGYPPGPLDMVWFFPALARIDGVAIQALTPEQIDGKSFQRWSRHYSWRDEVDDLSTHIRRVEAWLKGEFLRRR